MSNEEYRNVIWNAIVAVDRENSTHLNADNIGRVEILNRILKFDKCQFLDCLQHPDATNFKLFRIISEATHPCEIDSNGKKHRARENISFASKFCHFACFYLFEGEDEQDNYPIYDNVMRKILPKYVSHYNLQIRCLDDYIEYKKTVDEIISASNSHISRNGFDHLLWYYYKGRI